MTPIRMPTENFSGDEAGLMFRAVEILVSNLNGGNGNFSVASRSGVDGLNVTNSAEFSNHISNNLVKRRFPDAICKLIYTHGPLSKLHLPQRRLPPGPELY